MGIFVDEKYKTGDYAFPNRDINPQEKGNVYCRQNAQAIYSLFLNNQTAFGVTSMSRFDENRLYSRGEQSVEQYKSWLMGEVSDESSTTPVSVDSWDDLPVGRLHKRQGWSNVNWKALSPAPAIMNSLHGQFDKMDFDLYVNTIDADSRELMEDEKRKKMVEAKFMDWQIGFKKKAGIPVDEQMIYPRTQEEFDMFEAEDGFKLSVAVSMQKLVRYAFEVSKWDSVVRKKVLDDLICLGYGAVRDYYDAEDSKWKVKYLDPAHLVIQYSNEFDYSDAEFAGYMTYWTISNLRNKLPEVKEEELKKLAHQYFGKLGNPTDVSRWETFYSMLDPSSRCYRYDSFKVPVFEAEWMDFNSKKRLYYRNRHGRDLVIDLGYDKPVRPISEESKKMGATQEVKKICVRQPYQCSWVVGTDYVFDFGMVRMASREGLNKPQLTFHVEQLLQPSIIENLKPILDEITQLYLRYQNSVAMMVEKGYAVNTAMLGNVNYGGDTLPVQDVIKMWHQTGRLLYHYGGTGLYTGGAAVPVTPIDGGLGTRVEETVQAMEFAFKKIELFVGINLLSLGITPKPNTPTSTTDNAMQSTLNVLKPIIDATLEIKQSAGESMMRRMQIGIRNSDQIRNAYKGIISPTEIDALVEMEGSGVQYGLMLKPKPDSMMKAQFQKWLEVSLQDTRDGNAGLYTPDAIWFTSRLEAGEDILDLMRQMRYQIKKNKEEKEQSEQAKIQQQIDGNAQNEQMKSQNELNRLKTEGQQKMLEELVRNKGKKELTLMERNMALMDALREAADAEEGIVLGGRKV